MVPRLRVGLSKICRAQALICARCVPGNLNAPALQRLHYSKLFLNYNDTAIHTIFAIT